MSAKNIQNITVSMIPWRHQEIEVRRIEIQIQADGERFFSKHTVEVNDLESHFDAYWAMLGREIKEQLKKEE